MVLTLVLKAATDGIDVIFLVPFPCSGNFVLCPRGEVTASHWPVPSPALPPGVHSEHYPHGLPIRSISANRFRTKDLGIKISRAHRGKPGHRLADLPAMHREDENKPGAGLRKRLSYAPSAYLGPTPKSSMWAPWDLLRTSHGPSFWSMVLSEQPEVWLTGKCHLQRSCTGSLPGNSQKPVIQSEGAGPRGSFPCSLATDIQPAWHTAKAGWLERGMDCSQALGNTGWRWEVLPRPRILSSLTALTATCYGNPGLQACQLEGGVRPRCWPWGVAARRHQG